ncbi:MAG: hypothetical protein AB1589_32790, partial [Cyanobacteriota bacterium]
MQTREIFQQYAVKQSHSERGDLIEYSSNPTPITEAPINGGIASDGGLLLVPVFLIVLAWVLACLERFNFQKSFSKSKRLNTLNHAHQIPCSNCRFFNQSLYLKCAVHPSTVLSSEAMNCPDYCFNS